MSGTRAGGQGAIMCPYSVGGGGDRMMNSWWRARPGVAVMLAVAAAFVFGASGSASPVLPMVSPGAHPMVSGSQMPLARAPVGLRAAVRATLGRSSGRTAGAVKEATLSASDAAPGDRFGFQVAISGSTAVVGAYAKDSQAGAAYVFVRSGSVWSQQAK